MFSCEVHEFYSISLEDFGYTLVFCLSVCPNWLWGPTLGVLSMGVKLLGQEAGRECPSLAIAMNERSAPLHLIPF
jgi:hypothetical protein